jgi:hypothetical protein
MSKMTCRRTIARTIQANRIGILWLLSSASLFPIALLHSARRGTWRTRIPLERCYKLHMQKGKGGSNKGSSKGSSSLLFTKGKKGSPKGKERAKAKEKAKESRGRIKVIVRAKDRREMTLVA